MSDPYDLLRDDPDLAPLVEAHGELALDPAEDTFERLVTSIVNQQVSTASADAIRDRLYDNFEITPASIAAADPDTLQDVGLSHQKATYVQNIADAYLEHGYDREYFAALSNEAVHDELTAITGVGEWTADMFLMFGLGREDVFPVGDLGIRKGMQTLYGDETTRAEMRDLATNWQPYRSYASLYLWRAADD
jgi:DNA-3-methyladenine glycosylase II